MKHSDWFRRGFKVTQRSSQKREITRIYACTPIKGYGKTRVKREFPQSRDAAVDLLYKGYYIVVARGYI
jgi:hypothetical protein